MPSAEMLQRLDRVIDYVRNALPRLELADLGQPRTDEDGPITCGWALLHALEHAYLHLGHLLARPGDQRMVGWSKKTELI